MKPVTAVALVTRKHGDRFAREWLDLGGITSEWIRAFGRSGILIWPDDKEAQAIYQNIEDEIRGRVYDAIRPVVSNVFAAAANEIFARERGLPQPTITKRRP